MLSYCTNIHPAESWADTKCALMTHVPSIRRELRALNSPLATEPLGVGLRLSAVAAEELLTDTNELDAFKDWLTQQNARVETLNGFPYGNFHGQRVKENVFKPDWTTPQRFEYTCNLFRILEKIGSPDVEKLTVSTLPASHSQFKANEDRLFARLDAMAGFLDALSNKTGKLMQLGLEPEPFGHFDDTDGVVRFFNELRNRSHRPLLIERHLGLTYDTCHFAIVNEEPELTLSALDENNISLSKVQFSNAPELTVNTPDDLELLRQFDEGVYFHQTGILCADGGHLRFPDLPDALDFAHANMSKAAASSVWRLHYHIPLYSSPAAPWRDTGYMIDRTLDYLRRHPDNTPHYEVETYTWSVLPESLKTDLDVQIARELNFIKSRS